MLVRKILWICFMLFGLPRILALQTNFSTAKQTCESIGKELLTMSTKTEYDNALDLTSRFSHSWLNTYWNETLQTYQWGDGKIVGVNKWGIGQPRNLYYTETCALLTPNGTWETALCKKNNHYICSDGKDIGNIISGTEPVNFDAAFDHCLKTGKPLPIIQTEQEVEYYENFSRAHDVWLGMYKSNNVFKWLTGDEVSPKFQWSKAQQRVKHLQINPQTDPPTLVEEDSSESFTCQQPVARRKGKLRNRFKFVTPKAKLLGPSLTKFYFKSKTECAVECSKSDYCFKYTRGIHACALYGDIRYQTSSSSSAKPLWTREYQQ